jgi:prepilin-type N-terminal cleavage/methylation domain-containing protein
MNSGFTIYDLRFTSRKRLGTRLRSRGFTLIELLVVIAVIAILASFTVYALHGVYRSKYISTARAEMHQLETAIDSYHDTYGFYPPDTPVTAASGLGVALINPLYYELKGVTNNGTAYKTLDGSATINTTDVPNVFQNVNGFANCSKPGTGEDAAPARDFLHELTPRQTATYTTNGIQATLLVASVGGPSSLYTPLGVPGVNPWRYRSTGTLTNNPGSYELWVQLAIGGTLGGGAHPQTNLVCNWDKSVQINNPLP